MGWAKKHLNVSDRAAIAASLYKVTETGKASGKGWINGYCPLHAEDNPSFGYNPVEDVFHCMAGCTKDGDLIDLFCLVEGYEASAGFLEFKKRYGDGVESLPAMQDGAGRDKAAPDGHQKAGPEEDLPEVDIEQMRAAYTGFPELPENWQKRLEATRGWSAAVIAEFGLKLQTHYRCKYSGELKAVHDGMGRIVMPIADLDGIQNLRLYDPASTGKNKIISWGRGIGQNRLFPYPSRGDGLVWLCEGEGDMLCARSLGLESYTQTAKRMRWPEDQVRHFQGRDVVICYDADVAGDKYARAAAESLLGTASSIRIIIWPDFMLQDGELPLKHGQDLTDFIITHGRGKNDLELLLASAKVIDELDDVKTESFWQFFGITASGRPGFQPRLLAERLLQDFDLLNDPTTGLLYRWNGTYFERYEKDNLRRQAINYLGNESNKGRYDDAVSQAVILSTIPSGRSVNDREGWICLKNGMFNVDTLELAPHKKDYYATIQVNVHFNPDKPKNCPRWLKFLQETIQTKEPIEQLQEFYGYCLTRETRYEMCLITIGDGGDGKSTAQRVLRHLVGADNCTSVSFDGLEDQFQRVSLYNKMINLSSEVGGRAMDSEYFKKIVSGDSITASFKHKDNFEFVPYAKLVFALNKMMKIIDNSDGLYRRLLPIHFKRQFLPGDPARDPHLEEKLIAEDEGIFAWALVGLERLRKRGCFDLSCDETQALLKGYRRQNSPIYAFVEDCCVVGAAFETSKEDMYKQYKAYCAANGFGAVHRENFWIDLRQVVKNIKLSRPRIAGERIRSVKGVGLLAASSEE
jgi:putative DNA primase/helicase